MQPETLARDHAGTTPADLILQNLIAAIGQKRYEHWFLDKTTFRTCGDELIVSVANPFLLSWLPQSFRTTLVAAAQPVLGLSAHVQFVVCDEFLRAENLTSDQTHLTSAEPGQTSAEPGQRLIRLNDDPLPQSAKAVAANSKPSPGKRSTAKSLTRQPHDQHSRIVSQSDSEGTLIVTEPLVTEPSQLGETLNLRKGNVLTGLQSAGQQYVRRYAELGSFIAGKSNEFALSAAHEICSAPGQQFQSLFIHGPVGIGKTHLLEGICRELKQRYPRQQAMYLTAEAFANYFTQALREHKIPGFRQKFRNVDAIIIDDVDFLDGKRGIQEEFLFTLQHMEAHGKVVISAAHGHPRLLTKLSNELQTRLLAGMVCRIDTPDSELRRQFIHRKLEWQASSLTPEVIDYLVDRFRNSIRELDGALKTLLAFQRMQSKRLGVTTARQVLADLERDCIRIVRLGDIESAVCSLFGVTAAELKSTKRQKSLSQPRMLAMYLARKHTRAAYQEIGQFFGNRNHSTVMNAERKMQASLGNNSQLTIQSRTWQMKELVTAVEERLQVG